jgi:CheY-like chemotaxis protein
MLTGVLPLPEVETSDMLAKMLKRSFYAIKPLGEHRHAPPAELTRIIEKMMKIDLKLRYQTMEEVVHDLEAYQSQLIATAAPPPPPPATVFRKVAEPVAGEAAEPFDFLSEEDGFNGDDFEVRAVHVKNVLCVEVQDQIQEAFRKTLSAMGYRVLLVRDAERAAERYREAPPDAVVFDADGLGPKALDAFLDMHEKAHDDGHDLAALVLLGPRQGALSQRLPTDDRLIVLSKPIKMKDIQDAIAQLVPISR